MPRRIATLWVSGIAVVILAVVAFILPVPYAEMAPGPTYDTLGANAGKDLIEITGHQTYPTQGHLNMVTVSVTAQDYRMSLVNALQDWAASNRAVVPKETIYPPGQTAEQSNEQNAAEFQDSQDSATVAALHELGIEPTATLSEVGQITPGFPAAGKLQVNDVIIAVDGTKIPQQGSAAANAGDLIRSLIEKHAAGSTVAFTVTRGGHEMDLTVPTVAADDGTGKKVTIVGFVPAVVHQFPFDVKLQLDNVGGPSAGLMFALGIIEKLSPRDITGGRFIAGTGTIDDQGDVGPIGGVQMKTIGARDAGATVFLTPADNCADAKKNTPGGLRLVKVNSLADALSALTALRAGTGNVPSC